MENQMQTLEKLFKIAGYENYEDLTPFEFYPVTKNIKIATFDTKTQKKSFDRVKAVVYKGKASGYRVFINGNLGFMCTKDHLFFESFSGEYKRAEDLFPKFVGVSGEGNNVEIRLEKSDDLFPVLDLEVEGNHTYLTNGVLSHNTFGGVAKILSEGLKDIAPYLSKHDVSLILINQERDLIGGFSPVPGAKSTPGGEARKFWASWRARVTRIEYIKEKGSSTGAVSGIKMKVRNVKSKIGVPCREALMELDFKTGFNSDNEYLSFIVALMCERKGPYYSNEAWGMKVLGAPAVGKFLEEHPDIYAQAKIDVNALLCGETILDANNMEPEGEGNDAMTPEEKAWTDYANKVDPESDENFVEV